MHDVRFAEHLAAFIEVARLGSFSAAARARSSTPSSVTRQIDTLEEALGTQLFVRTTRLVRLTEAGKVLLARATPILDALADARAEIASLRVPCRMYADLRKTLRHSGRRNTHEPSSWAAYRDRSD
jgi:DNA-binding transcriptional LysR family regulator